MSVWLAVMFGFLTYPVFWWMSRTWDHWTERFRYKAARKRFIKDMSARVREFAPGAAAPNAAAPTPAPVQPELAPAPPMVNNAPAPDAEPSAPEAPPAPAPG